MCLGLPRRTRRRPRCCGTCVVVSSLGSTLSAVWDVTQRVVLGATAVGAVIACGAATTPGGRRLLRSMSAEFTSSPEGAQVFQLLQYLLLLLVARTFEYITGVTGALTLVYLGIFGMQLQGWLRNIPGPEEARARVEALEKGIPYVKPVQPPATGDDEQSGPAPASDSSL